MPDIYMTYTPEQLFASYEKAAPPVRALLDDPNLGAYIFGVCAKYGVSGEKALDIEDMTVHALLGLEPLPDLRKALRESAGLSVQTAQEVVAEFEKDMFPLAGIGGASVSPPAASAPVVLVSSVPATLAVSATGAPPANLPTGEGVSVIPGPSAAPAPPKIAPAPAPSVAPIDTSVRFVVPESPRLTPRDIFEKKLRAAQELGIGHIPASAPEVPIAPFAPVSADASFSTPPASKPYKGMDPYKELPEV